ncbi:galactoside 2-alpha-L-fucosyltransferase-like [Phoenix dactylifera]|uniref:Fucosyltransferase n=1 Tax=Phoenix dactylifera TaxID=42345 RepID=A0A8B7MWD3_PHODC|nr:galactoside 2-alpha-L-fucosyltransferase-like [Phoenix dactylifera]
MGGASKAGMEKRDGCGNFSPGVVLIACITTLPLLVLAVGAYQSRSLDWLHAVGLVSLKGSEDDSFVSTPAPVDKLLGGLLAPGFDEESCLSRYQSALYRKASPHLPSRYLLARLRKYEAQHKKCGPGTDPYKKAIEQFKSNHSMGPMECNYVVWTPYNGLGNRMLTIASTFLYALLNNRILLIHAPSDLDDLFCEPFSKTSWVLPSDFPIIDRLSSFDIHTPQSYANMLAKKVIDKHSNGSLPAYVYLHLTHDYSELDKLFFCEDDQLFLKKFPWLVLKSDNYFIPALFLVPEYEEELRRLFPSRETVSHHLGRYLFHPTNAVWGMITRYYEAYLAKAEEKMGIQIRIFPFAHISSENLLAQILNCSRNENLLPEISVEGSSTTKAVRSKSVLVASLYTGYADKIRDMYYEHAATTGEIISVFQPSHEEKQHTEKQAHNQKALAEIYLLSFSDVLVTSSWSTFGYMAQGLGGVKPYILAFPEDGKAPNPPCRRAMSMEPCFHSPPTYDCKARKNVDKGALGRHVRHCEDVSRGLKLFD